MAGTIRIAAILMLGFCCAQVAFCGPIHDATRKGELAKVATLLKHNPDLISSKDKMGNTPLHLAALHNQLAIAELLIADGADVNAENNPVLEWSGRDKRAGETPLTLALFSFHHKEMMELLLTHGANVNLTMRDGVTPLHRAIERELPYDVELLLANGADPNTFVGELTPLHLALKSPRIKILELLLDYGADPNLKDWQGFTPMLYAESGSDPKVVALLRAHGGH